MSQPRIHMKKLKELLRLKHQSMLTNRQMGKALNISASTVSYYLRGTEAAGIKWPLPDTMTDQELMLVNNAMIFNLSGESIRKKS